MEKPLLKFRRKMVWVVPRWSQRLGSWLCHMLELAGGLPEIVKFSPPAQQREKMSVRG